MSAEEFHRRHILAGYPAPLRPGECSECDSIHDTGKPPPWWYVLDTERKRKRGRPKQPDRLTADMRDAAASEAEWNRHCEEAFDS